MPDSHQAWLCYYKKVVYVFIFVEQVHYCRLHSGKLFVVIALGDVRVVLHLHGRDTIDHAVVAR